MAPMTSTWGLLLLVAAAAAADPKDAKMAAVNKVVSLLEDLKTKVMEEGTEEAKTYDTFACFCKDNIKGRQDGITAGKDGKAKLITAIGESTDTRDGQDKDIKSLVDTIDKANKALKKAKKKNDKAVEVFEVNSADLKNAIQGLDGAIKVMKTNKGDTPAASFLQISPEVKNTIEKYAAMADALGLASGASVAALLQTPGSLVAETSSLDKIEPYAFHSNDIISTLETLQTDFKKEKSNLDADEKKRSDAYKKFKKEKDAFVVKKEKALDDKKDARDKTITQLATESQDFSGISAQLLDDMQYLQELADVCSDKAKTWDVRTKVRSDELTALAAAIGIVKGTVSKQTSKATVRLLQKFSATRAEAMVHDEDAMEAVEADAEQQEDSGSFPLNFLQTSPLDGVGRADRELQKELDHPELMSPIGEHDHASASPKDGRLAVMMLLRKQGVVLHSSMLTDLATKIAGDPFIKVKKLIQELIERMLQEAANESNQKGWCDKSIGDAEQKRDITAEKLANLNAEMGELESRRDKLVEELATLATEIKELTKAQKDADEVRKKEKAENKATVEEATVGLSAVQEAITILDHFYKTAAKSKVDLKLIQGPKDDMPDAGFDSGEAYTGASGDAGGVIGMLEVIESDFTRTIKVTEKAESQASDDHLKFTTETQSSLAEKNMANDEKTEARDDTLKKLSDAKDSMSDKTDSLINTLKELLELQPACVDTAMSYEERVAAREAELKALQKALCIFVNFEKFGPDAADAGC